MSRTHSVEYLLTCFNGRNGNDSKAKERRIPGFFNKTASRRAQTIPTSLIWLSKNVGQLLLAPTPCEGFLGTLIALGTCLIKATSQTALTQRDEGSKSRCFSTVSTSLAWAERPPRSVCMQQVIIGYTSVR
jgi:hypothetical protein